MQNISTGVELDMFSASRGCPFNCTFCSFNFNPWGEKRNGSGRSPESIVEELAQIKAPTGKVYSDHCSIEELKQLRRKLSKEFYSKRQYLRILNKMRRSGLLKLFLSPSSANPARIVSYLLKALVANHKR